MTDSSTLVAGFYGFAPINDPEALCQSAKALAEKLTLKGTILIAEEGVNGTIAGASQAVEAMLAHLQARLGTKASLQITRSEAAAPPFARMKVKHKREIVTMGAKRPALGEAAIAVKAKDWNALITAGDVALIDTRNDYEVAIGAFAGAIDPQTERFRDFPGWFDSQAEALRAAGKTKVAMYCTGGIRCERAGAYVRSHGFDAVYQLEGGILRYLAEVEPDDSQWRGACFVFDERVALGHGLDAMGYAMCKACGHPVSPTDQQRDDYRAGEQCRHCATAGDGAA